ncbi:MAG: hypothetical protein PHF74_00520 [Dehalococcoidales bacterium]|nr:hypothetical protein [Dehalococcoidales bacterium]
MNFFKFIRLVLIDEGIFKNTLRNTSALLGILASTVVLGVYHLLYGILLFFIFLWLLTMTWAYRKWRGELSKNWIEKYKLGHNKYPLLPDYLLPFVHDRSYTRGEPLSRDIEIMRPSTQGWERLGKQQQEELLQLWEWTGNDRNELLKSIENTRPPSGQYQGLKYKR